MLNDNSNGISIVIIMTKVFIWNDGREKEIQGDEMT